MKTFYRIGCLTLLISGCLVRPILAGKVKTFIGANAAFVRYRTYQWLPPLVLTKVGTVENHPANIPLKEAVGRQLSLKGLTEVADGADLEIQAYLTSESIPQLEAVILSTGPGFDYGTQIASIGRYNRQGSLYLNLIDRRTKKFAWFAMETESLPNGVLTPEEIRAKLEKAAMEIFKKYPVKK